jgi:hypothetical protein
MEIAMVTGATTKIYQVAGHVFLAGYRSSHREKPEFEL